MQLIILGIIVLVIWVYIDDKKQKKKSPLGYLSFQKWLLFLKYTDLCSNIYQARSKIL